MPLSHPVLRSSGCEQFWDQCRDPLPWRIVPLALTLDNLLEDTGRSKLALLVTQLQVLLGENIQIVRDVSSSTTWVPELCDLWQITCPYLHPLCSLAQATGLDHLCDPRELHFSTHPISGLCDKNLRVWEEHTRTITAALQCLQWIDSRSPGIPKSTDAQVSSFHETA